MVGCLARNVGQLALPRADRGWQHEASGVKPPRSPTPKPPHAPLRIQILELGHQLERAALDPDRRVLVLAVKLLQRAAPELAREVGAR